MRNGTSWISKNTKLNPSNISLNGVYSTKKINQNTIISVFGGKIYTAAELEKLPDTSHIKQTSSQLNNDFYIGPIDENDKDPALYFNHSCSPNTYIKDSLFLVSIKNINKGDEITFDYAHSHNRFLDFECNCGSKNCRKFIGSNDHLDPEFQKKNKKYFPNWMKKLIQD